MHWPPRFLSSAPKARQHCESHPEIAAIVLRDEPGAELEAINLQPGDMVPAPACIALDESPWESA